MRVRLKSDDPFDTFRLDNLWDFREFARLSDEVIEVVYGDTVRYKVLELFLEKKGPFSLIGVARELQAPRSSTRATCVGGKWYLGEIRAALDKLVRAELVVAEADGNRPYRYSLNRQSVLVQILTRARSASRWLDRRTRRLLR